MIFKRPSETVFHTSARMIDGCFTILCNIIQRIICALKLLRTYLVKCVYSQLEIMVINRENDFLIYIYILSHGVTSYL